MFMLTFLVVYTSHFSLCTPFYCNNELNPKWPPLLFFPHDERAEIQEITFNVSSFNFNTIDSFYTPEMSTNKCQWHNNADIW